MDASRLFSRVGLAIALTLILGGNAGAQVVINELLASNAATNVDPDLGASADWLELFNTSASAVDLSLYALSDDPSEPLQYPLPSGFSLAPGGYLLVWCDSTGTTGTAPHANFSLGAGGEAATLTRISDGVAIDTVTWGPQTTDISWARIPNATGAFAPSDPPTPGVGNVAGQPGAAPVLTPGTGLYSGPVSVTASAGPGATIRYTLDGTVPTASSPVFPLLLGVGTTNPVRARAFYTAQPESEVTTASYMIGVASEIPIVDIVLPPNDLFDPTTGIYANFDETGIEWEREAHISVIAPDGSRVDEVTAGLRIHGGSSRDYAKKGFRLHFRAGYGAAEWSLPYLERSARNAFQYLVLRAGGNDTFLVPSSSQVRQVTYVRDELTREWHAQLGQPASDGFFCSLYLNGQYWGLYNPVERLREPFMDDYFGGGDWDVINGSWLSGPGFFPEAAEGDLVGWTEFVAWFGANDLSQPAAWAELQRRLDVRGYLAYFVLDIFTQNHDWPQNNFVAARRRDDPHDVWRFLQWDGEWGMRLFQFGTPDPTDTLAWALDSQLFRRENPGQGKAPLSLLFEKILSNSIGRRLFISKMEEALNFEFRPEKTVAEFNAAIDSVDAEEAREAARWAAFSLRTEAQHNADFAAAILNVRDFLQTRPGVVRAFMISHLGLAGTEPLALTISGAGGGRVAVNGRAVAPPWDGVFFADSPVELTALPDAGSSFAGWTGALTSSDTTVTYTAATLAQRSIDAAFSLGTAPVDLPDVVINEYWLNDNETPYATIGGRGIRGDWVELLVADTAGADLRGWRLTNNPTSDATGTSDDGDGSIVLPNIPELAAVPAFTCLLFVTTNDPANDAVFPVDDLDHSDRQMIFYVGNAALDTATDPGFTIGTNDEAIALLAPGSSPTFVDDITVDFIAEGTRVTPASFGAAAQGVLFDPAFVGIGDDDGAFFRNSPGLGLNNDNGDDPNRDDAQPGPGGWVVDPPSNFTGDAPGAANLLTPGRPNFGQVFVGVTGEFTNLLTTP